MDDTNPYAPPKAALELAPESPPSGAAPSYKLFTPGQVFLAVCLGTPLAGTYLLSLNRGRLGHPDRARTTLIAGVFLTVVLVGLARVLPDSVGRPLPLIVAISSWQYAKQDQPLLDAHVARGGEKEPWWKAFGFGLVAMALALAALTAIMLASGE